MTARSPLVLVHHPIDALLAPCEVAGIRLAPQASDPLAAAANDCGPEGASERDDVYAAVGARVLPYSPRA